MEETGTKFMKTCFLETQVVRMWAQPEVRGAAQSRTQKAHLAAGVLSMAPEPQKQLVAWSLNGLLKQEGARGAPAAFPTLCNRNEHFESLRLSCRSLICQIHPIDLRFIGTTDFHFLLV